MYRICRLKFIASRWAICSIQHHTIVKVACMVSLVCAADAFVVMSRSLSVADREE